MIKNIASVHLPANRKLFLKSYWPAFVIVFMVASYGATIRRLENPSCFEVLGVNLGEFNIYFVLILFPGLIFLATIWLSLQGLKIKRHGYFPPLDSVLLFDIRSYRLRKPGLVGGVLFYSPLFVIIPFVIAITFRGSFISQVKENQTHMATQCYSQNY